MEGTPSIKQVPLVQDWDHCMYTIYPPPYVYNYPLYTLDAYIFD